MGFNATIKLFRQTLSLENQAKWLGLWALQEIEEEVLVLWMPRGKLHYLYHIKHFCFLCAGPLTGIHCPLHKLTTPWSLDLPQGARLLSPLNNSLDILPFFAALKTWMYLLPNKNNFSLLQRSLIGFFKCPYSSPLPNLTAFVPLILHINTPSFPFFLFFFFSNKIY